MSIWSLCWSCNLIHFIMCCLNDLNIDENSSFRLTELSITFIPSHTRSTILIQLLKCLYLFRSVFYKMTNQSDVSNYESKPYGRLIR